MIAYYRILLSVILTLAVIIVSCKKDDEKEPEIPPTKYEVVKVETGVGNFMIWLYDVTPLHKNNFLTLTGQGFYDSLLFHRVKYDFVIQGGDPEGTGYGGPGYTIPAEIIDTMHHKYGSVGAARLGDDYNPDRESNGSQYYIVCDPDGEPFLDGKYTVFGQLMEGNDVLHKIGKVKVVGEKPAETVYIRKMRILKDIATAKPGK